MDRWTFVQMNECTDEQIICEEIDGQMNWQMNISRRDNRLVNLDT